MSISSHRPSHQHHHHHHHHHPSHNPDSDAQLRGNKRPFSVNNFERKLVMFDDYLSEITYKNSGESPEERRNKILDNLRFDEFCSHVRGIFGEDLKGSHLNDVYKKIRINPDCHLDWSELFGYENNEVTETKPGEDAGLLSNHTNDKLSPVDEVVVFINSFKFRVGDASGDRARRDILQGIYFAPDVDFFITVAQKGVISIWNNKLKLQTCTTLKEHIDGWLNGCCYLPNLKRILITAERTLTVWDFRNIKQSIANSSSLIRILSMSATTCIDSVNKYNKHKDMDKVILGDTFGHIIVFEISANELSFNNTKPDLVEPTKRVIDIDNLKGHYVKKKVHDEAVVKVKYIPELSSFISCSGSSKISLSIEELNKFEYKDFKINRQIGVPKGINTFCYCSKAQLIACGGHDKTIRLFNPFVLTRVSGKLLGHMFTIVDIVCNEKDQQLISLSSERVFKVWDLFSFKCLQTFSENESSMGEKRISCMEFDVKRERLITCSSVICCWPLARSVQDTMQIPHTHERPLVAVTNSSSQIASVCNESTIKVWESDSGRLLYAIPHAHGSGIEISCMKADPTGFRLATGAMNGSIKIWDFGAGQEIKNLPGKKQDSQADAVLALNYYKRNEEAIIIACGWSNEIRMFLDSHDSNQLVFLRTLNDFTDIIKDVSLSSLSNSVIPPIKSSMLDDYFNDTPMDYKPSYKSSTPNNLSKAKISTGDMKEAVASNTQIDDSKSKINKIDLDCMYNHIVNCMYYHEEQNVLLTGGDSEMIVWNLSEKTPSKIIKFRSDYEASPALKKALMEVFSIGFQEAVNLRKFTMIRVVIHKVRTMETIREALPKSGGIHHSESNKDPKDEETMSVEYKITTQLVERKFDALIITGHEDSAVRIWNFEGDLLNEVVSTISLLTCGPITSIISDPDANYAYIGDARGYITIWSIGGFIENWFNKLKSDSTSSTSKGFNPRKTPEISLNDNTAANVNLLVCFKAHTSKVVDMVYGPTSNIFFSASTDESVRIWYGLRGVFVGFLGQAKNISVPINDLVDVTQPYDISEAPTYGNKNQINKNNMGLAEYYLILDKNKLKAKKEKKPEGIDTSPKNLTPPEIKLIHSSIQLSRQPSRMPSGAADARRKKKSDLVAKRQNKVTRSENFFGALVKPKHSVDSMHDKNLYRSLNMECSIFSSLPLYKETNMDKNIDLKLLMMTQNPYRKNKKEVSYLGNNKNAYQFTIKK